MKTQQKTIWLGEMELLGYPVKIISYNVEEIKRQLIREHQKAHRQAKTGHYLQTWDELSKFTEVSIRAIELGKVVWP